MKRKGACVMLEQRRVLRSLFHVTHPELTLKKCGDQVQIHAVKSRADFANGAP